MPDAPKLRAVLILLWMVATVGALVSCQSLSSQPAPAALADGLYPVVASEDSAEKLTVAAGHRAVINDRRFVKPELRPEPEWVLLPNVPAVALELAEAPTEGDGRLNLTFTTQAAQNLASFTEQSIGKRVAIVIGGDVVTIHVIRTSIDGGKLQVSC